MTDDTSLSSDVAKSNESEKVEKKQAVEQTGNCYWYKLRTLVQLTYKF